MDETNIARLRRFQQKMKRPAGVWCDSDYVGLLTCQLAIQLGISIPDEVAVLGLYDYRVARIHEPSLSSIPQPGQTIGYEAMRILDDALLRDAPVLPRTVIPPPDVVCRESTGGGRAGHWVRRAQTCIAENACEGISVEEVARYARVSKQTLTKGFHTMLNTTPGAEIRRIRLMKAKQCLANTRMSITTVAGLCGYDQPSKFSNFIKRETGLTPREFRRRSRQIP